MSDHSNKVEVVEMAHAPEKIDANGPGQALRNARYALRKSETDIAKEFNLSKDYIIALENDEYTKLPGEAFIRGYLRAYAGVVGLSADEVVAKFNATEYATQAQESQQLISTIGSLHVNHRDKRIRWISYSIIALFVILVLVWWNKQTSPVESEMAQLTAIGTQEEIPLTSNDVNIDNTGTYSS